MIISITTVSNSIFLGCKYSLANGIESLKDNGYKNEFLGELTTADISLDNSFFGGNGGSDILGNNKIISSTFEFASFNNHGKEGKSYFYYTDDFFKDASTNYNNHLSTTSIELALAGIANCMEDAKDKYGNLKDFMAKMGFNNITPNEDYLNPPDSDTMGSVCANKPIYIKMYR